MVGPGCTEDEQRGIGESRHPGRLRHHLLCGGAGEVELQESDLGDLLGLWREAEPEPRLTTDRFSGSGL